MGTVASACLAALGFGAAPAMASYTAQVQNGTLQIKGDGASDKLVLLNEPGAVALDVGADGTTDFSFDRTTFTAINVDAGKGADEVTVQDLTAQALPDGSLTIDGGPGDDTIRGGNGGETIIGGAGDDFVDPNRGNDVVSLGAGTDTDQWDPGDGSDTVEGDGGKDTLQFNGSNAAENIEISANGSRVRLSRNVAQITMDLEGIENMNVRALGSADTVTVGDLTGTGVTNANVDLTGFDGNGDGAADTVNVNGTAGADNVDVSSSAGKDVVSGLATQVQVAGGEAADNVSVNTLGGDDTTSGGVDFTGPAPVTIDGGTGNDTTTYKGSATADTIGIARNGVDKVATFTATGAPVNVTAVENLDVQGLGGADQIIGQNGIAGLTKLTIDGGADDDTLAGGDGDDVLLGGAGNDLLDGNRGNDVVRGGGGQDTFQWDPGDASDTIEGDAGKDTMAFNGSNAAEKIDVSANGPRVSLTRDIALVTMDINAVEALNVRALGSADTITVNDLSDTDLKNVGVDLSGFDGTGDGAADTVVANGSDKKENVSVTRSGGQVATTGLAAQTTISGSEPANDTLDVNTLGGNDQATVAPDVSDLIVPIVDLGADE
jgi:Ca2+-binding RTX toxin-like protein